MPMTTTMFTNSTEGDLFVTVAPEEHTYRIEPAEYVTIICDSLLEIAFGIDVKADRKVYIAPNFDLEKLVNTNIIPVTVLINGEAAESRKFRHRRVDS